MIYNNINSIPTRSPSKRTGINGSYVPVRKLTVAHLFQTSKKKCTMVYTLTNINKAGAESAKMKTIWMCSICHMEDPVR